MSYTSKATINNQIYGWSHKIQKHKARSLEYEAFEMFTLTINDVFHREPAKPSAILNCDHSLSHLLLLAWFNILFCLPHIIILTIYKPYVCKYIPCSHCSLPEQFEKTPEGISTLRASVDQTVSDDPNCSSKLSLLLRGEHVGKYSYRVMWVAPTRLGTILAIY